jgi:hypothetical protein
MVSGGSDNPGGLKNHARRCHVACQDNPEPAAQSPGRAGRAAGGGPPGGGGAGGRGRRIRLPS